MKKIWNLFYSKLSENHEKMTLKSKFGNCEKLVPTQKLTRMFGLKFGMQGLNTYGTESVLWYPNFFYQQSVNKFDKKNSV